MHLMGRRRTKDRHLPPHLYRRGNAYYYRHPNGREEKIAPAEDLPLALVKWAKLEGATLAPDAVTFGPVAEQWKLAWLPTVAQRTQRDYIRQAENLKKVFGNSALDAITPNDVATYRDKRSAKIQANREIAVLSIIFGWAREHGYTHMPNPCAGLRRNKEHGRSVYMSDAVFDAIYSHGDQSVRDAMAIAVRTGADVSVILSVKRTAVVGDELRMGRTKTDTPVRYRLKGEDGKPNDLGKIIDEMLTRKRNATGPNLVQDQNGQRIPYYTFADRFDVARTKAGYQPGEYQFRDIRPKVATDQEDIQRAQDLLGHRHRSTTERHYIRRGKLVDPAK
jgi:integrase